MPKTLLLADDSVVIQKLVGLSFANEDITLVTTDNGDDALKRAKELRPDLVLADVVMPGKNGYEVCEAIKADAQLSHIPVLLLTGTFEAFDEERARQVGSNGHITKPFEAQGLVDRVADLLSQTPAAPQTPAPVQDQPPAPTPVAPAAAPTPAPPAPPAPQPDIAIGTHSGASTPAAAAEADLDDAYDFFDDDLQQDLGVPGDAAPPRLGTDISDSAFEFGSDLDALASADAGADPETLDTSFEFDSPNDLTTVVAPEEMSPTPPPAPKPNLSADLDAPDATQVVLGETMIAEDFGAPQPAPVTSLDERLAEPVPAVDLEAPTIPPAPAQAAPPMLADDLFDDPAPAPTPVAIAEMPMAPPPIPVQPTPAPTAAPAPAPAPVMEAPSPAPETPASLDLGASLDTTDEMDPLTDIAPPAPEMPAVELDAPPALDLSHEAPALADAADSTHSGYDVSMSDLGDPLAGSSPLDSAEPPVRAPEIEPEVLATDIGISDPDPVAAATTASGPVGPDLSPMMRERLHETLEKIAWEAFADVSDSIVRQVLERVESIVWEVVPQMAEALIQEEIRQMKDED